MPVPRRTCSILVAVCLAGSACSDGGGNGTGATPLGAVQVTISTSGRVLDRDGYAITTQGQAAVHAPVNGPVIRQLPVGTHILRLSGVAENCQIQGAESATVHVQAGATAQASFAIECRADRVAFVALNPAGETGLYVERLDGSGRQRLATPVIPGRIAWSPDGHRIAYTAPSGYVSVSGKAGRHLWVVDIATGTQTQLTTTGFINVEPTWSPDGTRIVYRSQEDRAAHCDLWMINSNGTGARKLTDMRDRLTCLSDPAWAPDGSRLMATAVGAGSTREFVWMEPETGGLTSIDWVSTGQQPAWAPDGSRLAWLDVIDDGGQRFYPLRTARPDGTDIRTVALMPGPGFVAWVDATTLGMSVQTSTAGPSGFRSDIWTVHLDGSGLARSPVGDELIHYYLGWK